ncbi:MAG TPA: hypothetical protein VGJ93_06560 [Desulfuromonadaceae bacterium]
MSSGVSSADFKASPLTAACVSAPVLAASVVVLVTEDNGEFPRSKPAKGLCAGIPEIAEAVEESGALTCEATANGIGVVIIICPISISYHHLSFLDFYGHGQQYCP